MRETVVLQTTRLYEAEAQQELLAEHEIDSRIAAVPGDDVEALMAGGAHQLLVSSHQAEFARSLLAEFEHDDDDEPDEEFLARLDGEQSAHRPGTMVVAALLVFALLAPLVFALLSN